MIFFCFFHSLRGWTGALLRRMARSLLLLSVSLRAVGKRVVSLGSQLRWLAGRMKFGLMLSDL